MRSEPLHVLHLFSRTADGFLVRLWLDVLERFSPSEFRFTVLVPSDSGGRGTGHSPHIIIEELPALGNPANPVFFLRSCLTLRSRFSREPVHIVHSHFPGMSILSECLRGTFRESGRAATLYSPAGDWAAAQPSRLLLWGLRRAARNVDRIVCLDAGEEARLLELEIAKKYQITDIPLPVPDPASAFPDRDSVAESLELPRDGRWIGVFLPGLARRDLRNLLMDLAPLAEIDGESHVVCVVRPLRLGEARSLARRLRLAERFRFSADLLAWESLAPHLAVAVFPTGGLVSLAAALVALGVPRPLWVRNDLLWMHLLPEEENASVRYGPVYRMKEDVAAILRSPEGSGAACPACLALNPRRAGPIADRVRSLYLDILAEKGGVRR